MTDPRQEIFVIEQEIDILAEQLERSHKVALLAQAATGVGAVLLGLLIAGALGRSPIALVVGVAAVLGGIALSGSNRATAREIRASIRDREARRADLIEHMNLEAVSL
jgi:hypothetical protein